MRTRDGAPSILCASARALSEPARILVVRLSHLGDVVCSLGILQALHTAYPRAEIGWAVQPEFRGLLDGMPGLARVLTFERRGGWRAWLALRRELAEFDAELAVDAQGNWKSACVARLSGATRRVGFARSDWREPLASLFVPERAGQAAGPHLVERIHALCTHLTGAACPPTDLGLSPAERRRGREALEARRTGHGGRLAVLHLSSPEDVRGWPLSAWLALVQGLVDAGRPVLVLSGPAEESAGRELEARLAGAPGVTHWVGQKGLRELAAVLTAAAAEGGDFVSCDSGPMHLAWAAGMRVQVLEGPFSAARTGPWPPTAHAEIRAPVEPPCAPCFARRCRHPAGRVCMLDIRVDDVLARLRS